MIRERGDMLWMQEAAGDQDSVLVNYGVWVHRGAGGGRWPMLLMGMVRHATPDLPAARGAAVFMVIPRSAEVLSVACYPDVPLTEYAGDPNGSPSIINGDYPWLYGLAEPDAVAAGLGALVAAGCTSR